MSNYNINKLSWQMSRLYVMFCMPKITMNKDTGEFLSVDYFWTNEEAKETYNQLSLLLAKELSDEALEHRARMMSQN